MNIPIGLWAKPRTVFLGIGLISMILLGCNLTQVDNTPSETPSGEIDSNTVPPTVFPPTTAGVTGGWLPVAAGIEQRALELEVSAGRQVSVVAVRLDPAQVTFRVHYTPGEPHTMGEWRALLPDADVIVNGAFFDELHQALGLVVSEGRFYGLSFEGYGGMFQVTTGGVRVRSLVSDPYLDEALWQAVQGFPMLIETGGVLASQGEGFDEGSRRTAVGQDRAGRILFIVVPYSRVTLAEFQQGLLGSDLDLHIAFGLDGGRSTGMIVRTSQGDELTPALDQTPSVIAAYAP